MNPMTVQYIVWGILGALAIATIAICALSDYLNGDQLYSPFKDQ